MTAPTSSPRLPARTVILDGPDALAREAARRVVAALAASPHRQPAVCLAGGSTPKALYGLLATRFAAEIPWDRVHWFWGDERLVSPDSPDSNEHLAVAAMLSRQPVPADRLHPVPTAGLTVENAAAAYERELRRFADAARTPGQPLFDVTLLGMGPDGHTASLFPGTPAADETERWVAPVPVPGLPPFVARVTLTRPALRSGRTVLFLASGAGKAATLARVAAGEDLPATVVAEESGATWLVDRAAAGGDTR